MQTTSLVQIETSDQLLLPALLFSTPDSSKRAVICLHGNGGSSIIRHQEATQSLANALNEVGFSHLALSNRGAGYITKFSRPAGDSYLGGMAYERIEECALDIDAAIAFLQERGYEEIVLLGFSTGANKICVYNKLRPSNQIARYILACGGDDTGLTYQDWGKEMFERLLAEGRKAVAEGRGRELIQELIETRTYFLSWQSLLDMCEPDGAYNIFPFYEQFYGRLGTKELFQEFSSITKPSLVVYGESDEYAYGRLPEIMDLLKSKAHPEAAMEFATIPGADHGFTGKGQELARTIAQFLA